MEFWLSIVVFLVAYVLIIIDKIHRTVVALVGASVLLVLGVISQEKAIESVDFNTIGLLVGMMIIVGITRQSGVFEYLAVKATKAVKGRPLGILVMLSLVTAVLSALLDNVTTVLLVVPVTFAIADRLKLSPMPFLFAEIIASNIGGTATLVGDPPNIMIGSAAGLGYLDFLTVLALPSLVILMITLGIMVLWYKKDLVAGEQEIEAVLALDEMNMIKDRLLLKKSLWVLALTTVGFLLHQVFHLESATIALFGAALLMLVSGEDPDETLLTVEWPTIFFFLGLFVIVGGLEHTGVLDMIAKWALDLTRGSVMATGMLVLWLSAIASGFVDNIPFVATMIPLLKTMGELSGMSLDSIWWALALGACLGGNGTLIGASANVIVAGIAERMGNPIRFVDFLKVGFPLMILSIVISNIYLYLVFWR